MAGIKETKELVEFGLVLSKSLKSALADGSVGFGDLGELYAIVTAASPALSGIEQVPAELSDISAAEFEELEALVVKIVGVVAKEEVAMIAQQALAIAKQVALMFKLLK